MQHCAFHSNLEIHEIYNSFVLNALYDF